MVLDILKIIASLATAATGLLALFMPRVVPGFTGLSPVGGRGISEIRAIFGGLFVALGIAPLIFKGDTYVMLGWGYLAIALVRIISIFFDKAPDKSNWISFIIEVIFGVILIL
jgi:hypothetical protein